MEHQEILHRCFRCGYCKLPGNYMDINCPAYLAFRFETYSPGGRMWLFRAWLDDKITASHRFGEIMFSCATCGHFECGVPPADDCCSPGCDCGAGYSFIPDLGCKGDPFCFAHAETLCRATHGVWHPAGNKKPEQTR